MRGGQKWGLIDWVIVAFLVFLSTLFARILLEEVTRR